MRSFRRFARDSAQQAVTITGNGNIAMWRDDQKACRSIHWVTMDLGIDSQERSVLVCRTKARATKDSFGERADNVSP
jgi:hypothetical protein